MNQEAERLASLLTRALGHLPASGAVGCVAIDGLRVLSAAGGLAGLLAGRCSSREREVFSSFSLEKRRLEWLAGRLAAKQAAGRLVPARLQFETASEPGGRPCWRDFPRPKAPALSISHSGGLALALVSETAACGIDIQLWSERIENLRERFCLPGEVELLLAEPGCSAPDGRNRETAALLLLWAVKEALRKAAIDPVLPGFLTLRVEEAESLPLAGGGLALRLAASGGFFQQQPVLALFAGDYAVALTCAG